ncbi:MAG: hypothetical protein HUJ68_11915 [Clostridia bacterium]|nr:hypothetical protein [Clostridia bacterium]
MSNPIEFINLTPMNDMISKCEIKILYTGKNRNKSYISKETATKMANTLPGTPIVGYYLEEVEDFKDHAEELVIDDKGIRLEKITVPYGFVPTDTKVWWQNFIDDDGVEREYLVAEGYLWTGRYPETKKVIEQGRPQSMELSELTLVGEWGNVSGEWTKFNNEEEEYFIINEATFEALCILGKNVPPCFEGANITKSNNIVYSLNKETFKEEMLEFLKDLKYTLKEGEEEMSEELNNNIDNNEADFAKKEENKENKDTKENKEDTKPEDNKEDEKKKKKEDEEDYACGKKKKYSLDEIVEYQELLSKYSELVDKYNKVSDELNNLKPQYSLLENKVIEIENKEKDEMINSFYMLSDEDKKEVIENKANYSLDDIEAKLSVICVRKKVNFDLEDSSKNEDNTEGIKTFNIDNSCDSTPAWLKAVDMIAKNRR